MSMSIGASSSSAASYIQQLKQQPIGGAKKAAESDPLEMLMQALSGNAESSASTTTAPKSGGSAPARPAFGTDTLGALIDAQSEAVSDRDTTPVAGQMDKTNTTASSGADSASVDQTTASLNKSATQLLDQWMKLQSQVLNVATTTLSAVV